MRKMLQATTRYHRKAAGNHRIGNPPARHRGLPGPSRPEPRKRPKRVRKGVPCRGAPRVRHGARTSPKTQLRTLLGLFSDSVADSLGTLGLAGAGHPLGLFSDSFGVPGPKGPETSVPHRSVPNHRNNKNVFSVLVTPSAVPVAHHLLASLSFFFFIFSLYLSLNLVVSLFWQRNSQVTR